MQNQYEAILGEKNRDYYLAGFEQFDKQGAGLKPSWSKAAFFFGGFWALYRKMYAWFFVYLGVLALSIALENAGPSGASTIVLLMYSVVFPIYANALYHNSIKKKIARAQLVTSDESKVLESLRDTGGVHKWVIWVFALTHAIGIALIIFMAFIPLLARL